MIAVNAPSDTPGIEEVDMDLSTLEVIVVEADGQKVMVGLR
ncbi:hypothetical protein ACVWVR_004266 [Ewingella americana]